MPFPNFHAARQTDPDQYDKFAHSKNKLGNGIDAIFGIKNGKSEIQSIRFNKTKFTVAQAKKWLKDHDFKTTVEPASEAETFSTSTSDVAQHAKRMPMGDPRTKKKNKKLVKKLIATNKKNTIAECVNILLERKSYFEVLKLNKLPLTDDERKICFEKKAVWHYASSKHPITGKMVKEVSAIWKAKHNGKMVYVTNTHRAYNTASTLEGAINKFHKCIKSTA